MKKTSTRILRTMGSFTLILSILMSCACTSKDGGKKKGPKFSIYEQTTTTTEETTTTETLPPDTTTTTEETMPTDDTVPSTTAMTLPDVEKKYFGDEASSRLHELDAQLFNDSYQDTDILTFQFSFETPETYGFEWPEQGIAPWEPDDGTGVTYYEDFLVSLLEIDDSELELEDQILYKTMLRDIQLDISLEGETYYTTPLNDLTGDNVNIPILFATILFDDEADVERYLTMLDDVKPYFESLFQYEQKRAELGYTLPDQQLTTTIESMEAVYQNHEGNYMYTTFEDRIKDMEMDEAKKQEYIARNKEILDTSFFPAYEELANNMRTLLGTAKTSGSLSEMEGGKEFYEKYFQLESGTNLTIPEAMEILEEAMQKYIEEFNMLTANMTDDQILDILMGTASFATGSFETDLELCKEKYRGDFPDIGEIQYNVYHIPESLSENFSPAAYMQCPYDQLSKNLLLVNDLGGGADVPTAGHEAFPGHMYEINYHMMNAKSYYMLDGTTAYREGWSTYSESYIMRYTDFDYATYQAYHLLLELVMNMYMGAYLDMGFHYYGWDLAECAKRMSDILAGTIVAQLYNDQLWEMQADWTLTLAKEIPCYFVSYCFGNYYCTNIINDAVEKYGNDYSMTEIHKAYLDMGPSYYELLEEYMPIFVEKQH